MHLLLIILSSRLGCISKLTGRLASWSIWSLEGTIYDSDYVAQMPVENSADTKSNNSGSSASSDTLDVLFRIPECIDSILDGRRQCSFDDVPLCKQALTQIASHLKACHSQFWELQGDWKSATCAGNFCLLCGLLTIIPTGNREARACGEGAGANGH